LVLLAAVVVLGLVPVGASGLVAVLGLLAAAGVPGLMMVAGVLGLMMVMGALGLIVAAQALSLVVALLVSFCSRTRYYVRLPGLAGVLYYTYLGCLRCRRTASCALAWRALSGIKAFDIANETL